MIVIHPSSDAEILLDLADAARGLALSSQFDDHETETTKLARRFAESPAGFRFRALFERWSWEWIRDSLPNSDA